MTRESDFPGNDLDIELSERCVCAVCAESRELYRAGNYVEMGGRSAHLNLFNDSSLSDISFESRFNKNDTKNKRNVGNPA